MTIKKKLSNGTIQHDLLSLVQADLIETDSILQAGPFTDHLTASEVYSERSIVSGVGVFECSLDTIGDYDRFANILYALPINYEAFPTRREWGANLITIDGREYRLAKWLKRQGVPEDVITFYSQQVKKTTAKRFLTISGLPQHIAGMSYYSDTFENCQHPEDPLSVHLAGSLNDDRLYVAMMHDALEDVTDMDGALLARVVMRLVEFEGVEHLVPTRFYGTDEGRADLDRCLEKLSEVAVHGSSIRECKHEADSLVSRERHSGGYTVERTEDVHVLHSVQTAVPTKCPMCDGTKKHHVYSGACDSMVAIKCPACKGMAVLDAHVSIDIDEWIEVTVKDAVRPYNELYSFYEDNDEWWCRVELSLSGMREWGNKWSK